MVLAYLLWALGGNDSWMRAWHLASVIPLAAALIRFDRLAGRADGTPVEDLISRDSVMVGCELAWLIMFAVGL
jgi:decaprenyl-phosphate phosphoribosyltransferase